MKLRIVWVGKTKNPHMAELCADYIARIKHFFPLEISDVKENKLLASLDPSERVIALDPKGKTWTSDQFAKFVQQHMTSDARRLTFIIGDHAGLSGEIKSRADILWSLSPLTFTHELSRVLLLEQIYRSLSVVHNFPYSR